MPYPSAKFGQYSLAPQFWQYRERSQVEWAVVRSPARYQTGQHEFSFNAWKDDLLWNLLV
ncbi:hypothetical protein K9N68_37955 (plasmid) [Kovacikia minuta CCNUW1]|uniref:hypothetical protein n=1 Tax=Kovacikia minuta TaxID=2931930 RepID=UPI001CCA32FB|nr:hypothetical protein [Kovacikia minuta]UBF29991.1 hypothetical protein K9N68_37955 [Kovacikia minuta CCNUW1]